MEQIISGIYETGKVIGRDGTVMDLESGIDQREGQFLFNVIKQDASIVKTLEVGCGLGLSGLHICSAIRGRAGAAHIVIDPFQNTNWRGIGVKNLEEAGIDFFELIEAKSEFALPRLLENREGSIDLVFVDGWHTFDHTLLDCFYATRLLRVGGYLVADDVSLPSIASVVSFLKSYPCYEEYGSVADAGVTPSWKGRIARSLGLPNSARPPVVRMVALKKTAEDNRSWDWHVSQSS